MSHSPRLGNRPGRRIHLALCSVILVAACQGSQPQPAKQETARPAPKQAPTVPPANVSHGEAPIGSPATPPPVDPQAPARSRTRLHQIRFEMKHLPVGVSAGVTYDGWTFGTLPGPTLRVTQGDTIRFTLVNRAPIPHSMDFHAAEIAPSRYYVNVNPGDSIAYRFVARVPGAFLYHCGTAPVAAHIANGMYGALIVDPPSARQPAKEFVLVQSEFYLTEARAGANRSLDWQKLLNLAPDNVVFNGRVAQYAEHPIPVKVGELIRLYVVNAGPNRISAFHIVGGIFGRVFLDGTSKSPLEGVQTVDVPVGGGAIFEIRLREAGKYPFVTHAFADATKGAVGIFEATQE